MLLQCLVLIAGTRRTVHDDEMRIAFLTTLMDGTMSMLQSRIGPLFCFSFETCTKKFPPKKHRANSQMYVPIVRVQALTKVNLVYIMPVA